MTHTRTLTHCADNQTRHTEEFSNAKADIFMDHVNAHQIGRPSLLRFPPELLAEIFMAVVKREPAREHPDLEKKSCSPALTLLHVCSRWRKAAIDTLRLWSEIQINLKHKPEGLLSLLKQYMTWSKQAPLHLTITYENKPETWNQVLDIIVPQAHRWEHIKFHLLDQDFQFGLAPVKSHLHSLRALHLSFYYPERCTVDVYEWASHLTTLTLEGVVSPDLMKLPWTQIEELECSEFTIALHAIKFSKNLLSCHLYMDIFASIPPSRGTPALICNSNIKVLEVTCLTIDEGSISQFFHSLALPSLQILKVAPQAQLVDIDFWPGFSLFLHRSSKLLTTLQLKRLPLSSAQFTQILELVPYVMFLDIGCDETRGDHGNFDNDFMYRLNASHLGCLVPRLTSLWIDGPTTFDEASVAGMVASRRYIPSSTMDRVSLLQHLRLGCFGPHSIPFPLPSLCRFVSEGLEVTYQRPWEA